jgi:hypothetical protein
MLSLLLVLGLYMSVSAFQYNIYMSDKYEIYLAGADGGPRSWVSTVLGPRAYAKFQYPWTTFEFPPLCLAKYSIVRWKGG